MNQESIYIYISTISSAPPRRPEDSMLTRHNETLTQRAARELCSHGKASVNADVDGDHLEA